MQNSFKEAYEAAIVQADEMMNSFNIIMNAGIKQKLSQSLQGVRQQLLMAERVAARTLAKAEYEAEMIRRLETLNQACALITVAAKKNAIMLRYANLRNTVAALNEALILPVRQPQNPYHNNRGYNRGYVRQPAAAPKK